MSQGSPYGSQPNPFGNQNPYMPPQGQWNQQPGQWGAPEGYAPGVPVFCTVMFVVSLVFCIIRSLFVALGFVGMGMMKPDDPLLKAAFLEIGTGLGMVLCGVPGNALLLFKNQIGFYLGWGLIACTIGSILTGIVEMALTGGNMGRPPPPGAENALLVFTIFVATITVLIRLGIIVAYGAALIQFQNWYTQYGRKMV
jgi:hypothetical protein